MGDFNFTATAQCNYCGNLLESSDVDCDECSADDRSQQMFRRITSDDDSPESIVVESTPQYKWYKLEQELGDSWIAYQWLGPRKSVQRMVGTYAWDTIQDIPHRQMSVDAPKDVGEQ